MSREDLPEPTSPEPDAVGVPIEKTRWILAFDSSCGSCRTISEQVASACSGKLEMLPLAHPDVTNWRTAAFGESPRWAPTLLKVSPTSVRGWTGRRLVLPLVRFLGARPTVGVVRALGELREERTVGHVPDDALTRKRFLQLGTGVLIAGGLVVTGGIPAYAGRDPAESWVRANRNNLPTTYEGVTRYRMDYRRAIYRELPASTKSKLWSEHLHQFKMANPSLTGEQSAVLDEAMDLAAHPAYFEGSGAIVDNDRMKDSSIRAFGLPVATSVFATLGPPDADPTSTESAGVMTGGVVTADQRGCTCAVGDDWCNNSTHCFRTNCIRKGGCGWFWYSTCDGLCRN